MIHNFIADVRKGGDFLKSYWAKWSRKQVAFFHVRTVKWQSPTSSRANCMGDSNVIFKPPGLIRLGRIPYTNLACSQTLYFLFKVSRARVIKYKPQGIYWPPAQGAGGGGRRILFFFLELRARDVFEKNEKKYKTTSVYRLTRTTKAPNSKAFTCKLHHNAIHSKGLLTWAGWLALPRWLLSWYYKDRASPEPPFLYRD